ncbi:hypothetical protein OG765_13315 [Streptomyces sp. NBC_00555]|uniref:hypothetical protein n=1 Tax=Streptomyces sp. NBC_00555 TaxID=2903662 RepID=UPI00224CE7DF|nr:hypothetical protein [Streptomyces sp. NBC_00555]MCX5011961.1 hypothetical protein [Streptomyces sp. NBC_00555]
MPTALQLTQFIRFAMASLTERNSHHEFEALCLAVARRRIASNLLPATGPVSSGGDQGRDAESFRTYLPQEIGPASAFTRLATDETIVLACTIQRTDVPAKIRADVSSICSQGTLVDRIAYFTVQPVPVAKRHALQGKALTNHKVSLDIFDSEWLAQELAEPDLFYLAEAYLQVPAELAPAVAANEASLPDWYVQTRARWHGRVEYTGSLAEFGDLRSALRHATFDGEAIADLPDWLDYATKMLNTADPILVKPRLRYEIGVATLRGTGDMRTADRHVRDFFSSILPTSEDLGLLHDASVLLMYSKGAWSGHHTDIEFEELRSWNQLIKERVGEMLAANPLPNRRAHLHDLAASLSMQIKAADQPDNFRQELDSTGTTSPPRFTPDTNTVAINPNHVQVIDLDDAMAHLQSLCDLLPDAPLFPIERVADIFALLSPLLTDHPAYNQVREALDEATERVEGGAARAKKCQARAIQFLRVDRPLEALAEIHVMKVSTWNGDTLSGALHAMLLASKIYSELNLHLAAKQHCLAASAAASASRKPELMHFIPAGLLRAADCDFLSGSWLSAAALAEHAFEVQALFVDDPWDTDLHRDFAAVVSNHCMMLSASRQTHPQYVEFLQDIHTRTGLNTLVDPIINSTQVPENGKQDWISIAAANGCGRPFNDSGPIRSYQWSALGTTWSVSCANEKSTVMACERFVAAAQALMAELAPMDPLLLPTDIDVYITVSTQPDEPRQIPDNEASRWEIQLSASPSEFDSDPQGHLSELTIPLASILMTESVLPHERFAALLQACFQQGLGHKLVAGRPYDELAGILDDALYEQLAEFDGTSLLEVSEFHAQPHPQLAFPSHPGPGYSQEGAANDVRHRYEKLIPSARYTLSRLASSDAFRATVSTLRTEGWLDWHILLAVNNIIGNRRLTWEGIISPPTSRNESTRITEIMLRPEMKEDPQLPETSFGVNDLKDWLAFSAVATLRTLGLEYHRDTPNTTAIFAFLGARYAYWVTDVPHDERVLPR